MAEVSRRKEPVTDRVRAMETIQVLPLWLPLYYNNFLETKQFLINPLLVLHTFGLARSTYLTEKLEVIVSKKKRNKNAIGAAGPERCRRAAAATADQIET